MHEYGCTLTGWLLFMLLICHHSFAPIWLALGLNMVSQCGWTTCSWAPPSLLPGREYPERLNILTTLPDRLFFGPECPRILLVWFDIVHWEYLGRLNPFTTLPDRFKYLWTIISLVVTVMPTYRLRIYGEVEHLEYGAAWELECHHPDFFFFQINNSYVWGFTFHRSQISLGRCWDWQNICTEGRIRMVCCITGSIFLATLASLPLGWSVGQRLAQRGI